MGHIRCLPLLQSQSSRHWIFHLCCTPPLPSDPDSFLYIDLVLRMGWVNSPDLFCSTSETVVDLINTYISNLYKYFKTYPPIANLYYNASPSPTFALATHLQYINVYVNDINCLTQGNSIHQRRVTKIVLWGAEENIPFLTWQDKICG